MKEYLSFPVKALLIALITFVGSSITCGGNILLSSIIPEDSLFSLWIFEIGFIFIFGVNYITSSSRKIDITQLLISLAILFSISIMAFILLSFIVDMPIH